MEKALLNLMERIKLSKGIDLSIFDPDFLQHVLDKRKTETGTGTLAAYFRFLKTHPEEEDKLFSSLYITYSEFFRDPLVFSLLWKWIFPAILLQKAETAKKEIRIWSAATAAGQEAYSLAILLDDITQQSRFRNVSVQIFASDICPSAIQQAEEGFYREEQLQKVPYKYINEYFYPAGEGFRLIPRIRESVEFFTYDLLHAQTTSPPESIFGSFDLIYCSNLFIYYNEEHRNNILRKLLKNLNRKGILITGDAEKEMISSPFLQEISPPAALFQKKSSKERPHPPDGTLFRFRQKKNIFH